MAQQASTVKVPSSAASYSPATLDPDLRSQINTLLIREGHVSKIYDALLHSLHAHSSNWPTAVQAHALALLRSGEATTFPALIQRILDDIRAASSKPPSNNGNTASTNKSVNGDAKKLNNGTSSTDLSASLALPESVVNEALRITRQSLEAVCEIEESDG
ncbi:hypothetical protein CDD82_667 [Ophiocordyceps australis]|uniref:Uncharacterized protein n=1 Tax=Ophiocordyceps australis TaxID=1399860 RepID=A0A2C5ZK95_9HYPO|nr:hypothetical protein CDD82_667 [Ophiocordyceps australis]